MLGRAVIAMFIGGLSGIVMLYGLGMAGRYLLPCTLDTAAWTFACEQPDLATHQWLLYGLGLWWIISIPGYAAFGIGGVKPAWAAQILSLATVAFSFVILFRGYDITTPLQLGDRSLVAFGIVWLILPAALGLVVSGLTIEDDEEPAMYTGLETYSPSTTSR